jgi:hypothetical protein
VAVGVVALDTLRHLGRALARRLECVSPGRRSEAGLLHRLALLLIFWEVLFVPGLEVFLQVRQVHGRPLEVTTAPLIGEAWRRLQIGDHIGPHVRHERAGGAEEERRLSRN